MKLPFFKYQGTGNDFIMIDNRNQIFPTQNRTQIIQQWCHRRFGIGADGLIVLENHAHTDFRMIYFNADGKEGSMCGNGGRCIVAFAHYLGIIQNSTQFIAIDGLHQANIQGDIVELKMTDVEEIHTEDDFWTLDTGSPHYVTFVENIEAINALEEGQKIRYSPAFSEAGINVNWVEINDTQLTVRTYERGVEAETLSCGTGVTAAAIIYANTTEHTEIPIQTQGGQLTVKVEKKSPTHYTNIWLCGPAVQVFSGEIEW